MNPDSKEKKLVDELMDFGQRSNMEGIRQTLEELDAVDRKPAGPVSAPSKDAETPTADPRPRQMSQPSAGRPSLKPSAVSPSKSGSPT